MATTEINILLIEDNPGDVRLILEKLNESRHITYTITVAVNMSEAISRLSENKFDMIILDLNLPDSRRLASLDRVIEITGNMVPVIVLTILSEEETGILAIEHGAEDYLVKDSVNSVQMIRSIRYAIERKKMEMDLRENQEIFRQFMEHSPIYVFFKDERIRSVRLSRNYETMLGKPIEELLGRTMDELFPSEFAEKMIADDLQILINGMQVTQEEELNGRFYQTIKFPIHHMGKPKYLAGYTMDITDRRRAEEDLRQSEARYRSMFENNYAVMLLIDPLNGIIVDINQAAAEYYGYSRQVLTGKNISDISSPEKMVFHEGLELAVTDKNYHFFSRHVLHNGQERDVEVFCSPISYMGTDLMHCIIHDITERNKAVEALQISLNEKKELIKEIYHRTKNNMQVIISMFSLQSIYSGDKKFDKVLKDMENRIKAMSLVHEKLYKSRNLSRLDLKDYLIDLVENIISGYGITKDRILIIDKMENIEVLIDTAIPCGLVVNELVSNVVKYAFPEDQTGSLIIDLSMDSAGEITLIISDNGAGIGMNQYINNTHSMGLQIVKNIVEYQLKGRIELNNYMGTKWTVKFSDNVYEERI